MQTYRLYATMPPSLLCAAALAVVVRAFGDKVVVEDLASFAQAPERSAQSTPLSIGCSSA